MSDRTQAALDVLAERERQIAVEGWTPEHDDRHRLGEMAEAAGAYAAFAAGSIDGHASLLSTGLRLWPWAFACWKPTTPRATLVKAGALIIAEIERLDRLAAKVRAG